MLQFDRLPSRRIPRLVRAFDRRWNEHDATLLEVNGNLRLIERADGSVDWRAPHEIEEYN